MGSCDTVRHRQRAGACRCGVEKPRALRQGCVFQLFVQMALWDTLGSGMHQHFAPELFAGTSKTTTFYKVLTMPDGHWSEGGSWLARMNGILFETTSRDEGAGSARQLLCLCVCL